jgi:hypothetical protein
MPTNFIEIEAWGTIATMDEPQKETGQSENLQPNQAPTHEPATPLADPPATDTNNTQQSQNTPTPADNSNDNSIHFMSETPTVSPDSQTITWKASEFHAHDKSLGWYLTLSACAIGLAAILYLITRSIMTLVVVIVGGIILGMYASKQPSQVEYALDQHGIRIGSKQYLYAHFRLLIVTPNSSVPELTLIPNKRFMPSLSVRYLPDNQDAVLGILSKHLPLEERSLDPIDKLMARIRF